VQLADYFNVTTDYILGLSNEKRSVARDNRMSSRVENQYDLVIEYEQLNPDNQRVIEELMKALKELQKKEAAEQHRKKR
ncbi:MAG: hypothetical protein J6J86_04205, partial [Lachnospiraceae bacterium]|nr:hypothetical protein [Lachnospiraceae bacterium]